MLKRSLCILLALATLFSLSAPAFAEEAPVPAEEPVVADEPVEAAEPVETEEEAEEAPEEVVGEAEAEPETAASAISITYIDPDGALRGDLPATFEPKDDNHFDIKVVDTYGVSVIGTGSSYNNAYYADGLVVYRVTVYDTTEALTVRTYKLPTLRVKDGVNANALLSKTYTEQDRYAGTWYHDSVLEGDPVDVSSFIALKSGYVISDIKGGSLSRNPWVDDNNDNAYYRYNISPNPNPSEIVITIEYGDHYLLNTVKCTLVGGRFMLGGYRSVLLSPGAADSLWTYNTIVYGPSCRDEYNENFDAVVYMPASANDDYFLTVKGGTIVRDYKTDSVLAAKDLSNPTALAILIDENATELVITVNKRGTVTTPEPEPTAVPTLTAPTVLVAQTSEGIQVVWSPVAGAPRYMVYYNENNSGWKQIGTTTDTVYTYAAKYLKNGATYQFTVRCCADDKKTMLSGYKASASLQYTTQPEPTATPKPTTKPTATPVPKLAAPTVKIEKAADGIKVSWNAVSGSPRYMVYYKEGSGSWKKIGTTTSTTYTRKAANLKNGTTYAFTVRCCANDKKTLLSSYKASNSLKYSVNLAVPTVKIAKASGGIKVTWNKITGSPRYMVYYKEGSGGWKKIGTTTSTTYTRAAKYLKNNVKYTFTVRCCAADKKTLLSSYKASNSLTYKK